LANRRKISAGEDWGMLNWRSLTLILLLLSAGAYLAGATQDGLSREKSAVEQAAFPTNSPQEKFLAANILDQPSAQEASPEDLGFSVPVPEPALPAGVDAFNPPRSISGRSGPVVAEFSKTAGPDEIVAMTGVELDRSHFSIYSQTASDRQGSVISVKTLRSDQTAATILLPSSLPPWSMYLIWPERDGVGGKAFAVNRTEAWWIGPEAVTAGSMISVYGRNLSTSNGTSQSFIFIKPQNGVGQYVTPVSVNPFKVDFKTPDLAAGNYEVWTHNGHGGRFGWSGPLTLTILAKTPWAGQESHTINVTAYGAVGDGMGDDTDAIKAALAAAKDAAPTTIYFPTGIYTVTSSLEAPSDVRWRGDGADLTTIQLAGTIDKSMINGASRNAQFEKLTIDANQKTRGNALFSIPFVKNFKLRSVRIKAWGIAALDAQDASGLYIDSSELIENGSFYGSSRNVFMTNNRFRMTGYGESVVALWGGSNFSMVGNDLANADETVESGHGIGRFFVGQAHFGSLKNLYWGDNISHNAAPHNCSEVDCNKGEQICFEIVGSRLMSGFLNATSNTVRFGKLPASSRVSGEDLVIVGGKGAGQHRHIVSVDNGTATLDRPWNVIPDRSSQLALAAIASQAAIYRNTFEGRSSYAQHDSDSTAVLLYGNVYDVVVDNNNISQMRHAMMTVALASTSGLSPYFLQYSNNKIRNSNSGLYVGTTFADSGKAGIWGGLGNIYRGNSFSNLAYIGVEYEGWDHQGADYNASVFDRNAFVNLPFGFIDGYKLMWTHDGMFKSAPKLGSRKFNTILYKNTFDRGSAAFKSSTGYRSLYSGNTWLNAGSTWINFEFGNSGPELATP
jgi:polygalacturonase